VRGPLLHCEVACALQNYYYFLFLTLVDLGCLGLYLDKSSTCMLVGGWSACCCVEDGALVPLLVSMKGNE